MNRTGRNLLIVGGLAVLGYVGYRIVRGLAAALLIGGSAAPPAKAATRLDLGPYPFDFVAPAPQDTGLAWYDPAATVKRVAEENAKVPKLKAALHKETKGDGTKAVEALLPKCKEPDSAQALLEIMNEIVPQAKFAAPQPAAPGPAAPAAAAAKPTAAPQKGSGPVFTAEPAAALHAIAKVTDSLKARYATKEMGHFDPILLERAILLLGFHGAPDLPGAAKARQADGKEVPAIDPVTRATLRGLLGVEGAPQILAARALGQLGDLQTAREIIEQPGKYPGASIADFGPKAVEEFKQARLKQLKQGVEGFDNMVQGMRLTPKYQDVAIELAMAGDAGAGMAMQRNQVLELVQGDRDEVMARRIDMALRFPGTREGNAWMLNFDYLETNQPRTMAMILKAMDHDLRIVFGQKNWTDAQLTVLLTGTGIGMFSYLWHCLDVSGDTPMGRSWTPFYRQLEALFRKHYRKEMFPAFGSGRPKRALSVYARHLGLPPIGWPGKKPWTKFEWESELESNKKYVLLNGKIGIGDLPFMYGPNLGQCAHAGHLKGPEDF